MGIGGSIIMITRSQRKPGPMRLAHLIPEVLFTPFLAEVILPTQLCGYSRNDATFVISSETGRVLSPTRQSLIQFCSILSKLSPEDMKSTVTPIIWEVYGCQIRVPLETP